MISNPVQIPRDLTIDLSRKQVLDLSHARLRVPMPTDSQHHGVQKNECGHIDLGQRSDLPFCGRSPCRAPKREKDIAANLNTSMSSPDNLL